VVEYDGKQKKIQINRKNQNQNLIGDDKKKRVNGEGKTKTWSEMNMVWVRRVECEKSERN